MTAATIRPVSDSRRWSIVLLLMAVAAIHYMHRAAISVALPRLAAELALDPVAKGILLSAFFWSYALMQVPAGMLCDRWGVRWFFAVGFTIWSVASGLTGTAGGMHALILFQIVLGIGESALYPVMLKLISSLFSPADRGFPSALIGAGSRFGLALGVPLVAWLTLRFGWRSMFYAIGFLALLGLAPWFAAVPNWLGEKVPSRSGRFAVTFNRNLAGCSMVCFSLGYYQYILLTWLPDYLVTARHFPILDASLYASLSYFVWGFWGIAGGWISDRVARRGWSTMSVRKAAISSAYIAGVALIPAALVQGAWASVSLVVVASFVGLSTGNIIVLIQDSAPADELGAWSGVTNLAGNLGGVLSPAITGFLIGRTGSYVPAFSLAAGILLAGIPPLWSIADGSSALVHQKPTGSDC